MKIGPSPYPPIRTGNGIHQLKAGHSDSTSEAHSANRLSKMQESLQRLQAMPKQAEENKVGFLLRRLEMLKALMLYASPNQLKRIAEELKGISKELASIAKGLEGQSSNSLAAVAATDVPTDEGHLFVTALDGTPQAKVESTTKDIDPAQATVREEATETGKLGAQVQAYIDEEKEKTDDKGGLTSTAEETSGERSSPHGQDDLSLRALLKDAQKFLKEVIDQLKPKLDDTDKEARQYLVDAEKSLEKLGRTLSSSSQVGENFYTALGNLSPVSAANISAVSINISV